MRPASRSSSDAQLAVFVDLLARARADLQQVDLAVMLGIALEQPRIGLEALRQALGIVHAVDADRERAAGQAAGHALHHLVVDGARRRRARKASASMPIGSAKARIERPFSSTHSPSHRGAEHALGAVAEVARMLLGLEADQVVGAEIGDQLARRPAAPPSSTAARTGRAGRSRCGPWKPRSRSMRPNGIR